MLSQNCYALDIGFDSDHSDVEKIVEQSKRTGASTVKPSSAAVSHRKSTRASAVQVSAVYSMNNLHEGK